VRDFKLNFLFNFGGHPLKLRENKSIDNSASRRQVENKTGRCSLRPLLRKNPIQIPPKITNAMSQCDRTISCFPVTEQQ